MPDLSNSYESARRAIANRPQGVDLEIVFDTIERVRKAREDKAKTDKEYQIGLLNADIQARSAGIGSVSLDPVTNRPTLSPVSVSPIDQFLSQLPTGVSASPQTPTTQPQLPGSLPAPLQQGGIPTGIDILNTTLTQMAPVLRSLPPNQQRQALQNIISQSSKTISERSVPQKFTEGEARVVSKSDILNESIDEAANLIKSGVLSKNRVAKSIAIDSAHPVFAGKDIEPLQDLVNNIKRLTLFSDAGKALTKVEKDIVTPLLTFTGRESNEGIIKNLRRFGAEWSKISARIKRENPDVEQGVSINNIFEGLE